MTSLDPLGHDAIRVLTQALPVSQVAPPTTASVRLALELLQWACATGRCDEWDDYQGAGSRHVCLLRALTVGVPTC